MATGRRAAAVVLLAAMLPPGSDARSAEDHKAEATRLLREGNRDFYDKRWESALQKFAAAFELFPSPKILVSLGATYKELDRPVEALQAYERFLKEAGEKEANLRPQAEEALRALREVVGTLHVEAPDGTLVVYQDRVLGKAPFEPIPLRTGGYALKLVVPGRGEFIVPAEIVAGREANVRWEDPRARSEPPAVPPETPPAAPLAVPPPLPVAGPPAPPSGSAPTAAIGGAAVPREQRSRPLGAYLLLGAGVAVTGAGVVTNLMARSAASDANDAVAARACDADCADAADRRDGLAPISYALIGTGAAAAAGGVAWLMLGARSADRPGATVYLAPQRAFLVLELPAPAQR